MQGRNRYFRSSHLREAKFRAAIRYFAHNLRAWKIAELSDVSRPTINQLFMKLRIRIAQVCNASSPLSGEVEVDESYFGARRVRGKSRGARSGKPIVFGILERHGKVSEIVPDASRKQLQSAIRGHTYPGQHHPLGRLEKLQWAGGHGLQKEFLGASW